MGVSRQRCLSPTASVAAAVALSRKPGPIIGSRIRQEVRVCGHRVHARPTQLQLQLQLVFSHVWIAAVKANVDLTWEMISPATPIVNRSRMKSLRETHRSFVRHCLCIVVSLPSRRRHCLCIVFSLP